MKTMQTCLVLFLLLALALPRTAFADDKVSGMADYMSEISSSGYDGGSILSGDYVLGTGGSSSSGGGSSSSGGGSSSSGGETLGGDLVSSVTSSVSGFGGDLVGGAAGDMAGGAAGKLAGSAASSMFGGGVAGSLIGDFVSDKVGGYVSDKVGGFVSDKVGGMIGDAILSIPEIGSLQETINGLASNLKAAVIGPNLPHYRILWMFSGESVINELDSVFSGDYSNIEQGFQNLKEMF